MLRVPTTRLSIFILGLVCLSYQYSHSSLAKDVEQATPSKQAFNKEVVAKFNGPWAMAFLPDDRLLVTEKRGKLYLVTQTGKVSLPISGVPEVVNKGQGGLGDIVLHPNFTQNNLVYLSYVEASGNAPNKKGAVVIRAKLQLVSSDQGHENTGGSLTEITRIWQQYPKVSGNGHYGHRIAFDKDGFLFISSGERQKFDPAQDMSGNLGEIIRLNDDGSIPQDNPYVDQGGVTAQVWSSGHRNPLGLAFDNQGRLWNSEMGPLHGDELNLVQRGADYGYPTVSNGDHYSRKKIPDHDTRPEFEAPKAWWRPTIAPSGLIFYSAGKFEDWQNSALIPGLKSQAIIRVEITGDKAREVERFDMGRRIREIEQGPAGDLWVLEDGNGGRLLRLSPVL